MIDAKNLGRVVGVLLLLQAFGGFFGNFVLLDPVFAAPGFLVNAAPHATRVSLTVMLGLATAAVSLGIAITAWPLFSRHNARMTMWYAALAVALFALHVVENQTLLSLLSLSKAYAKTVAPDPVLFEALRAVVASSRNSAHYVTLVVAGCTLLVFYSLMYRYALVPRVLAAAGIVGALFQVAAVSMPIFGTPIVMQLLTPLGLAHFALAGWLLARGFRDHAPPAAA